MGGAVDGIGDQAVALVKVPALGVLHRIGDGNGYNIFQTLELAVYQGAMGPGAGIRHIQMIAARFRPKAASATRAGPAVGGDPITEGGFETFKSAVGFLRIVPVLVPDTIDEQTHYLSLFG